MYPNDWDSETKYMYTSNTEDVTENIRNRQENNFTCEEDRYDGNEKHQENTSLRLNAVGNIPSIVLAR